MHLIINHMVKLDHVDNTHCSFLVETIPRFSVKQVSMTHHWNFGISTIISYLISGSSIKNWCSEFHSQLLTCPTQHSFIDLSKVHTAWHTQWIQYDINRCSIFKEWHVFSTNDLSHNTFV